MASEGLEPVIIEDLVKFGEDRGFERGRAEGEARGRAEGEARGRAEAVLAVLEARGLSVSADERARITGCTDVRALEAWVRRAVTVKATAELFASPKRQLKTARSLP